MMGGNVPQVALLTQDSVEEEMSLTQLLAEESNAPYFALLGEKAAGAQQKSAAADAADQEQPPWDAEDETNSALEGGDKVEDGLARFLKDIMRTPKRSWSRYKKGGLRSCFGVRMERIGSFSGLGC
ncbi:C-type natriuretic peptide 3 [Merluccius polli]|uniref:C-type natriuretic peptide 3 n=1 Tax=Merluccius polli TaxID=89951 RepID=A0AA47NDV7_MERPO|nr:C-type natriuretic peptide 3 [Merluccius polli]